MKKDGMAINLITNHMTWKQRYKRMKTHYGWIDKQVAEICGYKSRESLIRSLRSAKVFPLMGMIHVFEKENNL